MDLLEAIIGQIIGNARYCIHGSITMKDKIILFVSEHNNAQEEIPDYIHGQKIEIRRSPL